MKTIIIIFSLFCFSPASFAKSNLVGAWINKGKTLSVQIVDDPANAPFTAGEVWTAITGKDQKKSIKTESFDLGCSAIQDMSGNTFGSCAIRVSAEKIQNIGAGPDYLFSVVGDEARQILSNLNTSDRFVLTYGKNEFSLEANRQKEAFSFLIFHELVQP